MTLNMQDLETAMNAAANAAITKDWYGQCFDSLKEYEEWAGDVFQFLFEKACEAIGIEFDEVEEEPDYTWKYIHDDVDETNYDPYCGCDMFEICGSIDEEW